MIEAVLEETGLKQLGYRGLLRLEDIYSRYMAIEKKRYQDELKRKQQVENAVKRAKRR